MDEKKTNEVEDECSRGGHEGDLLSSVPWDCGCGERGSENEVEVVLIQAPVPLGEIVVLLDEQLALLVDTSARLEPFDEEGRPVIVSPSRRGPVSEHPGHYFPHEVGKFLDEVTLDHGLVD